MITTQNKEVGEVKTQSINVSDVVTQDISLLTPKEIEIVVDNALLTEYASGDVTASVLSAGGEGDKTVSSTKIISLTEKAKTKYNKMRIRFTYTLNPNSYGGGGLTVNDTVIEQLVLTSGTYTRSKEMVFDISDITAVINARSWSSLSSYQSQMSIVYNSILLYKE